MKKYLRLTLLIPALCLLLGLSSGCSSNANDAPGNATARETSSGTEATDQTGQPAQPAQPANSPESTGDNTIRATITMEDGGVIVLELYPDLAPQSVRNFVYLARQGFYDGLVFHRIMKGFMIQGGDPSGTGYEGPGYSIKGEFAANGFANDLKHERGVLSMARSNDFDSAGSQFFIMHADNAGLDGSYAAFGRVISGMDVVDSIAGTPNSGPNGAVAEADKPVMRSVTIDDDVELPEPDRIR